ncbi:MAG: hypothetical protein ACFFCD_09805 [Promethearchaeota archaeon]
MNKLSDEFVLKITKDEKDNAIRIVIESPSMGLFYLCHIGSYEQERYISINGSLSAYEKVNMNHFEEIPVDAIGRKLPGFLSANQLLHFDGGFLNICTLIQKSVADFMPILKEKVNTLSSSNR